MSQVKEPKGKRAGLGSRTLVEIALLGGETDTSELAKIGKVTEEAVRGWIKEFRREQIAVIKQDSTWLTCVTEESVGKHRETAEGIAAEVKRIRAALKKTDPTSQKYHDTANILLKLEKRWSEMTGIESVLAAHRVALTAKAKTEEPEKKKPAPPRKVNPRVSGPVVPLD